MGIEDLGDEVRAVIGLSLLPPGGWADQVNFVEELAHWGRQGALKRIVRSARCKIFAEDKEPPEAIAVERITDPDFLENVALKYKDPFIRASAIGRITNMEILTRLSAPLSPLETKMDELGNSQIRNAALDRIKELQESSE